jgi:hypothetical protein
VCRGSAEAAADDYEPVADPTAVPDQSCTADADCGALAAQLQVQLFCDAACLGARGLVDDADLARDRGVCTTRICPEGSDDYDNPGCAEGYSCAERDDLYEKTCLPASTPTPTPAPAPAPLPTTAPTPTTPEPSPKAAAPSGGGPPAVPDDAAPASATAPCRMHAAALWIAACLMAGLLVV